MSKRFALLAAIVALLAMLLIAAVGYPWVLRYMEENAPSLDVANSNEKITGSVEVTANEISSLIDDWISRTIPYGSWVHIVSRVDSEEDSGIVLPNESANPTVI